MRNFMHVSKKAVPAMFRLIFVLAALVAVLHKILHILTVVNPHKSGETSYRSFFFVFFLLSLVVRVNLPCGDLLHNALEDVA